MKPPFCTYEPSKLTKHVSRVPFFEPEQYEDLLEPDTKSSLDAWPSDLRGKHEGGAGDRRDSREWERHCMVQTSVWHTHTRNVWDNDVSIEGTTEATCWLQNTSYASWSEQKSVLRRVTFFPSVKWITLSVQVREKDGDKICQQASELCTNHRCFLLRLTTNYSGCSQDPVVIVTGGKRGACSVRHLIVSVCERERERGREGEGEGEREAG